jgi:hypothetical protein
MSDALGAPSLAKCRFEHLQARAMFGRSFHPGSTLTTAAAWYHGTLHKLLDEEEETASKPQLNSVSSMDVKESRFDENRDQISLNERYYQSKSLSTSLDTAKPPY